MKISVIITCYNLSRYLSETIHSVLQQEPGAYTPEIVVVDDASTDGSAEVVACIRGCILVRHERNRGVLLSTLDGIAASRGEVLCFLDGDDLWDPRKLKIIAERFEHEPDLIYLSHDYSYIGSNGERLEVDDDSQEGLRTVQDRHEADRKMRDGILRYQGNVWLGSAHCLRRDAVDWNEFSSWVDGLPEPEMTYQDWPIAFWVASSNCGLLGYSPQKLMKYRIHDLNYSSDAGTPAKMLRNLRKGLNTVQATANILVRRGPELLNRRIEGKRLEYEYLTALYEGRVGHALQKFGRCVAKGYWSGAAFRKEVVRAVGVGTLGPERFTRLAKWRAQRSAGRQSCSRCFSSGPAPERPEAYDG